MDQSSGETHGLACPVKDFMRASIKHGQISCLAKSRELVLRRCTLQMYPTVRLRSGRDSCLSELAIAYVEVRFRCRRNVL